MFDTRKQTLIPEFRISELVMRACVLCYLAYLECDIFYMKWQDYKAQKTKVDAQHFYAKREDIVNDIFLGITKMPIFYDGSINSQLTRDAQAYLLEKDNVQYIVFRGTNNCLDLLTDFNFLQIPLPDYPVQDNIRVHKGFYMQFCSIKDSILEDFDPKKTTIFCGHSLGGGLATIAAMYFATIYKDTDITCVTFGAPRVGNSGFVKLFDSCVKNSERFVTMEDPIPQMSAVFEYLHTGKCYVLSENQVWSQEGDVSWLVRTCYAFIKIMRLFYMHSYNTYIKLLLNHYKNL